VEEEKGRGEGGLRQGTERQSVRKQTAQAFAEFNMPIIRDTLMIVLYAPL
jgi:hypothetical protein